MTTAAKTARPPSKAWISLLPYLALLAAVLYVQPFGNYPLNDDWQYARVTKRFIDTGVFHNDVQIAPAVVGQALLVWPFVKLFGFSHTLIRLVSMAMSVLLMLSLNAILKAADVRQGLRTLTLVALILSPLGLYFATTFMTESFGFGIALLGAAAWFWLRVKAGAARPGAGRVRVAEALAAAALCAASFWIRQYAALVYPALLGSALIPLALRRDGPALKSSLVATVLGLIFYAGIIASYFAWAKATSNLTAEFGSPLEQMTKLDGQAWGLDPGVFLVYITAFTLPLLMLFPWRAKRAWTVVWTVALAVTCAIVRSHVQRYGNGNPVANDWLHKTFPYLGNVLYQGGIGPVTLRDVLATSAPLRPRGIPWVWSVIEALLWAAALRWVLVAAAAQRLMHTREAPATAAASRVTTEVAWFGLLFALGSAFVVIQTYTVHAFDRYLYPVQIGALLLLSTLLNQELARRLPDSEAAPGRRRRTWGAVLAGAVLCIYATAGVHDEFRWQDAHWQLYNDALARGISPQNIAGTWEAQGWFAFDAFQANTPPPQCIGACSCQPGWYCLDDSYRIGMNIDEGYEVVAKASPGLHLSRTLPVYLLRRRLN